MTHFDMKPAKKILLIDDDQKFSIGIVALLTREGYAVTSSSNGKNGLEMIRTQKPDLILCDMMMPSPDGLQVKMEINQDEELRKIPFVFVSAKTSQAEITTSLGLGATDYILKPFVISELMEKINTILRPN